MKILFIGGTGNISSAVSEQVLALGHELWLLNRHGTEDLTDAFSLIGDIQKEHTLGELERHTWDVVVNWIAFNEADINRDLALFRRKTQQYIFISSASCYQNPGPTTWITERTPLANPHWEYSRNKIAAEAALMRAFNFEGFPATIVRPSHTYNRVIPITLGGWLEYTCVDRMKRGLPIVVQGDGTSLWTLTHASDFAAGFIGLLGRAEAIGEDFHITSDEHLSWNEIYQLTAKAAGAEADIVHVTSDRICQFDPDYTGTLLGDKSVSALFDNSKIKQIVPDFSAKTRFEEGIKNTITWFEADPSRKRINAETNLFLDRLIADARRPIV
jgi:nucleoside-diphosphate-sugar epimerase